MKTILILKDCKYAQSKPDLPILKFKTGEVEDLEDYMADSVIKNGDGEPEEVEDQTESDAAKDMSDSVIPEIKEKPRKTRQSRGKNKE